MFLLLNDVFVVQTMRILAQTNVFFSELLLYLQVALFSILLKVTVIQKHYMIGNVKDHFEQFSQNDQKLFFPLFLF